MPSTSFQPHSQARPPQAVAQFQAAVRFQGQQRKLEAARAYMATLQIAPGFYEAAFNLGLLLQEMGQAAEAIACYRQTLQFNPEFVPAWNQLGLALRNGGQLEEAIGCFRHALRVQPAASDVLNNLGNALRAQQKHAEAIACFEAALQHAPTNTEILLNLGNTLREEQRLDEAAKAITRALELRPDFAQAHCDQAFLWLLEGDFRRGFEAYEWRWRRPTFPPRSFASPLWQGEDLAGRTLLVHTEQGAGDAFQFVRLVPLLAARGARVLLECPATLATLFESVAGVADVIVRGNGLPPFDYHVPLMSLPHRLGLTLDSIPATIPYLHPPAERVVALPSPLGANARLKVGVVWQGNPDHKNDAQRSLPVAGLQPLLEIPEVACYSLQMGATLPAAAKGQGVINLSGAIHDFVDTAVLINQLDLVISVDTSVAHLAGALGRPVWLLLPFAPDWRWLLTRTDSPWYPTARLFRQPSRGDWNSVMQAVRAALEALLQSPRPAAALGRQSGLFARHTAEA